MKTILKIKLQKMGERTLWYQVLEQDMEIFSNYFEFSNDLGKIRSRQSPSLIPYDGPTLYLRGKHSNDDKLESVLCCGNSNERKDVYNKCIELLKSYAKTLEKPLGVGAEKLLYPNRLLTYDNDTISIDYMFLGDDYLYLKFNKLPRSVLQLTYYYYTCSNTYRALNCIKGEECLLRLDDVLISRSKILNIIIEKINEELGVSICPNFIHDKENDIIEIKGE
jgi:hypothetical protein